MAEGQEGQGQEQQRQQVPPTPGVGRDGIDLILHDHSEMKQWMDDFRRLGQNFAEQVSVGCRIIREVSIHSSAEERYLYPLIKSEMKNLAERDMLYDRNITDDQVMKELMQFLEKYSPDKPEEASPEFIKVYQKTAEKFFQVLLDHMEEEENWVLEPLRSILTLHQKEKLYDDFKWAKQHAPAHPHPEGPTGGMWAKLIHPAVAVTDKISDTIRGSHT